MRLTRKQQGTALAIGIPFGIFLILAGAEAGMNITETAKQCALKFPKWFGCALANHENLSGGLIGAGGAIFAGWLAWSAVRTQIELAERQTNLQKLMGPALERSGLLQEIAQLEAAITHAKELGEKIATNPAPVSPNARKLAALAQAHDFPPLAGNWQSYVWGTDLFRSVNRLERIGRDIVSQLHQPADQHPTIFADREGNATDAVEEFSQAVAVLAPTLDQKKARRTTVEAILDKNGFPY